MEKNLEYEYLDREPKADDVVECLENYSDQFTKGKLYICIKVLEKYVFVDIDDTGSRTNAYDRKIFKVVNSKPGSEAKVGDTCIVYGSNDGAENVSIGDIVTLLEECNGNGDNGFKCHHNLSNQVNKNNLIVICKKESNKNKEIDLRKTWCIANVPNHDKLRLLGYDPKPVGRHRCGDYYHILNSYEIYDSNVFNRDFKQVELNEDNEFVYVKEKEDDRNESSSNIIEKELNEDNSFTKYGFEKIKD